MPDLQTLSYVRADLAAGLNPRIPTGTRPDFTAMPGEAAGGVNVADVLEVALDVHLQRQPFGRRQAWVTVTTVDDSTDYVVTVNGNGVTYTAQGGDGAAEILAGLASAVLADAQMQANGVSAEVVNDSVHGGLALRVLGSPQGTSSFDVDVTGAGVLACAAEAQGCEVLLFGRHAPVGTAEDDAWVQVGSLGEDASVIYVNGAGGSTVHDVRRFSYAWAFIVSSWGDPNDGASVTTYLRVNLRPCRPTNTVE